MGAKLTTVNGEVKTGVTSSNPPPFTPTSCQNDEQKRHQKPRKLSRPVNNKAKLETTIKYWKGQDRKDKVRGDGYKRKRNGRSETYPKWTIDNDSNKNGAATRTEKQVLPHQRNNNQTDAAEEKTRESCESQERMKAKSRGRTFPEGIRKPCIRCCPKEFAAEPKKAPFIPHILKAINRNINQTSLGWSF